MTLPKLPNLPRNVEDAYPLAMLQAGGKRSRGVHPLQLRAKIEILVQQQGPLTQHRLARLVVSHHHLRRR